MAVRYVKFFRGTPAAYKALSVKDNDALYFVAEEDAGRGLLYLGEQLIAGGDTGVSIESFSSLFKAQANNGDILMWNSATNEFEITDASMIGASSAADGMSGFVPAPKAGDNEHFLRGDGTWAKAGLTDEQAQSIEGLKAQVTTIIGTDPNLSMRAVASQEVAKIVNGAPEAFNTLSEIADWIADHPKSISEINSKISGLDTRVSALEKVGVGNLADTLAALKAKDEQLSNSIDDLDWRLQWHAINDGK